MRSPPLSQLLLRRSTSSIKSTNPHLHLLSHRKRNKSTTTTYGYTQATALVHHKTGQPSTVLSLHKHALPPAHSNLLTLRTLAAPLNPADINQIQGVYATKPIFSTSSSSTEGAGTLGTSLLPACVPGNEGVFEVVAVGAQAARDADGHAGWKTGEWVIPRAVGLGTWRSFVQVDASRVMRIDARGVSAVDAARVSVNPLTAWRMLKDFMPLEGTDVVNTGRRQGEWVIQNGANSGVGRAVCQLARLWGINVIAVIRDRPGEEGKKLKTELLQLGATYVVSEEESQASDFVERVRSWTSNNNTDNTTSNNSNNSNSNSNSSNNKNNSGGVRLALNCVGGKAAIALAKTLEPGGCMVTYGAMSKQPLIMPAGLLIFRDIRFEGFWVSRWGERNPEEKERCIAGVLDLVRRGKFEMGPFVGVGWGSETTREDLVDAVQGTLDGFRSGKGVFVFDEM